MARAHPRPLSRAHVDPQLDDGSRIFFDRATDTFNGIFSVPALGGPERLVVADAAFPVALKLDEGPRSRVLWMQPTGATEEIPLKGDLRMIQRPLTPGAVRQGKLVLGADRSGLRNRHVIVEVHATEVACL